MKYPSIAAALLLGVLCFSLLACGKQNDINADSKNDDLSKRPQLQVTAVFPSQEEPYAQILRGIQDTAAPSGTKVAVHYTDGSGDQEAQLLARLSDSPGDGLIISPVGDTQSLVSLKRLGWKDVPLVLVDSALSNQGFALCILNENDLHQMGLTMGQTVRSYIESQLGGKANVAIFDHGDESVPALNGFLEAFDESEGITFVDDLILTDEETRSEEIATFLKEHQDTDILFCTSPELTEEASQVVTNSKYGSAIFGLGGSDTILSALDSGKGPMRAVAVHTPYDLGRQAMEALFAAERGDTASIVPGAVPTILSSGDQKALADYRGRT